MSPRGECPVSTHFLPFPVTTADAAKCQSGYRPCVGLMRRVRLNAKATAGFVSGH